MKLWHGILLVILLVVLPVISGCTGGSEISADEAIAIVRQYELEVSRTTGSGMGLGGEWDASYKGKGHWVVTSRVNKISLYTWDYYERSGIIYYRGIQYRQQ